LISFLIGIVALGLGMIGIPIRGVALLKSGTVGVRLAMSFVLCVWLYFMFLIAKHGFVTVEAYSSGPTVAPLYWLCLCGIWYIAEQVHKRGRSRSAKQDSTSNAPSKDF
jgi:hypothetical protein